MKRKFIALTAMAVLTISMATSAFAAPLTPALSYSFCGGGFGIMRDQDGNFLDREAFEDNLDELIADGYIRAEDRNYFLERYDWCADNGNDTVGVRGRRGRGCGMGRWR